ncbi:MAG: glycosyltransferase [Acidimicrobiales bacterium]
MSDDAPAPRHLRVLLSVRPYLGHLHPMIPLARALFRRGHGVAVATSEDVADVVVGAGLAWIPAGINPRQVPELSRTDADYGYPIVKAKVDDLLEVAIGDFRPDIIIRDPTDLAPIVVSEVVGALNVIYGLSRFIPKESWEILGADRTIARLRRHYRLPEEAGLESMFSGLYLAVLPPLLEVHNPLPVELVQPMAYVPWDGDERDTEEPPDHRAVGRPQVLVTLGTVYNVETDLLARFVEAFRDGEVDVLFALGEGADPRITEGAPVNVSFSRYLPFTKVLPRCDALLCHGGFNTVMSALLAGVPVVCVPLGSDHDHNAYICRREGFGIWLEEEDASPERIREAVATVIRDRGYAERVRAFRRQLDAAPSLDSAVRRMERLVEVEKAIP